MLIEQLKRLSLAGLDLWLEADRLRYRAPDGLLTPAVLADLKAHKDEIIALLRTAPEQIRAYPLSYGQRALWFIHAMDPTAAYNVAFAAQIHSRVDVAALQGAFQHLADRHPLLHGRFPQLDGEPVREEYPHTVDFQQIDAGLWSEEELHNQLTAAQHQPFDLVAGPILRVRLFTHGERQHTLLLVIHHIACDGQSFAILLEELRILYPALAVGQPATLPPLEHSYQDFVRWQREMLATDAPESEGARLGEYWRQQLAGDLPTLDLPLDRPRPPMQTFHGAAHIFEIDAAELAQVKALAQQAGATPFMLLLAAFQTLLHRYTGQTEIVVGSPTSGRTHSEFSPLVGYFVNPIVLRADLTDNPSFLELLAQVRRCALDGVSHQDYPFPLLVERLQPTRDPSRSPLFQVAYVYQRVQPNSDIARLMLPTDPSARVPWGGLELTPIDLVQQAGVFDLELEIRETATTLKCCLKYNCDLFDAATIARLAQHFQTLLHAILATPAEPVATLPLLTAAETEQLLVTWNATQRDYPIDQCLHQLFEAQVERTPDAVAVLFDEGGLGSKNSVDTMPRLFPTPYFLLPTRLTYRELDQRANQLAYHLQTLGVGPEVLVGIAVERSLEMVIGLYAILKAGGAYVPLDPTYPAERLAFMVADAGAPVLLTQAHLLDRLPETDAHIICLDRDWDAIAQQPTTKPPCAATADNLAYMIYTSGSTGKPKGALNTHRGICNRLLWMQEEYNLGADDHVLQKTPFSFDVSVWEFFWPLLVGARLVVAKPEGHKDPDYLTDLIQRQQITTLHFVPPMLQAFLQAPDVRECTTLRRVICSGEALPLALQQRFFALLPAVELHNLYGPTEAAIDVTYWTCRREETHSSVPIGRPVANTQIYLLDQHLQPVPIGVAGELYIGGVQVGRGYHNRPELTRGKFIPNPFGPGQLYRTGDLARYLVAPVGLPAIEFLGRLDHQVKVRGFRIELGEIEAVLAADPAVRESVVLLRNDRLGDGPGGPQLVAYVTPADPTLLNSTSLLATLHQRLAARLPEYMVPAQIFVLATLPLAPNGKLDRKALPAPDRTAAAAYAPPQTPVEETLAAIWGAVLRLPRVGMHDNFFALGGDSILSIQVVAKARQQGLQLTVQQIFQHQTIAGLATVAQVAAAPQAEQAAISGPVPLTPVQQWFFAQAPAEPHHFNQSVLLTTAPTLQSGVLEAALQALVTHHDALRLSFRQTASGWQQENLAPGQAVRLTVVDLAGQDATTQEQTMQTAAATAHASLELAAGNLLWAVLFQRGADEPGRLLLIIHHLAVDGVSWRILLEDLATAYQQAAAGAPVTLPPKTTAYQQWAEQLVVYAQQETLRQEFGFWLNSLQDNLPALPRDYTAADLSVHARNREADVVAVTVTLPADETHQLLHETGAAYNTQVDDLLLTALLAAYSQWSGDQRLLVELESHGRQDHFAQVDLSRTVGWFTAIYPVLLLLDGEFAAAPGDALKSVKEQLRRIPHRGIGYGLLRYLSQDEELRRAMQRLPRPQLLFNYLGQFAAETMAPDAPFHFLPTTLGPERSPQIQRPYLLEINALVVDGELRVEWRYSRHLHRSTTVETLAADFLANLRILIAHCQAPEAGGYTPSDFPYAAVDSAEFDKLTMLLEQLGKE
ncbi:MAG: amino acid adenylation domain-containing protein [Caldilineaceae bacterium]